MRRFVVAVFAALLVAGSAAANAAVAPAGRWSMTVRNDDATRVQLRLEYSDTTDGNWNASWSSPVAAADAGLSLERLRGAIGPVSFALQREPGTFNCTGSAGEGSGAGQFTYAQSPQFDAALASRGMGRPGAHQSLELAIAGVTLSFVDELRATGRQATVGDLVRVVQHGVTPRYVADLAALGYKTTSIDQLVRLRDHGVTPRYVGDLAAAGYKNLSADEMIALRDHGVNIAFVDRLRAHGYTNLSTRDLIRLRDSGL